MKFFTHLFQKIYLKPMNKISTMKAEEEEVIIFITDFRFRLTDFYLILTNTDIITIKQSLELLEFINIAEKVKEEI